MKIYIAGYTRDGVLRTFSNVPREYKSVVTELEMEKLSEGIQDGFLWRIHSNKMYSCTMISSLWDKKIDERRIPLIVSYVMDKEAAEFIMESPLRLSRLTEQLKGIERADVIQFSNAEVMESWDDALESDKDWDVVIDSKKAVGIVQAVVKMAVEEEAEFTGFVYEADAELFAALEMLPMALRMNFSFSFPFSGCGAGVCDVNVTDRETMQQGRMKSYNGWPLLQRIVLPEELEISEKTARVSNEIQRLYHTYGKVPLRDRMVENLVRRLEMLSYMNEYNEKPSKNLKKVIIKNKSKKLKIEELLKLTANAPSEELLSLVGGANTKEHAKKNENRDGKRNLKIEAGLFTVMAILTVMAVLVFQADVDGKTVYLLLRFESETCFKYILVFLLGLFAGILSVRIGGARKEKK